MINHNGLSDYNKTGIVSELTAGTRLFSDLNLRMPIHPFRKDVLPLTDIDAIKQSVRNLVLTNRGERPFRNDIGGDISKQLFENYNSYIGFEIQDSIETVIKQYESRVSDVVVQIIPLPDRNAITATIGFKVANQYREFDLEFELDRLR